MILHPAFFASEYFTFSGAPNGGFVNTFVNRPFLKEFVNKCGNFVLHVWVSTLSPLTQ